MHHIMVYILYEKYIDVIERQNCTEQKIEETMREAGRQRSSIHCFIPKWKQKSSLANLSGVSAGG